MGGGKCLQNENQEIEELHNSLHDLNDWVDLYRQMDMKDKLIESLKQKLSQKE
jgi:hypothetical protein